MISGVHVRSARALLGWSATTLALNAHVGLSTVLRLERNRGAPGGNAATLARIERALRLAGVEFVIGEGRYGVMLKTTNDVLAEMFGMATPPAGTKMLADDSRDLNGKPVGSGKWRRLP